MQADFFADSLSGQRIDEDDREKNTMQNLQRPSQLKRRPIYNDRKDRPT
ncbi:hypothetical protein LEP1GSC188_1083 [Leptospira weilii serovar Topaz str. LT2116]|uniref:Uncharacterized protein n=1 Tax=Leptospira weilii serovar Topaz str. LT2116 TaxID=1088540 RepID=M3GSS0_9LEPT|nr:hypothetical protein LEP1GSC188_1083 [Leptospira weilii serovar Topaz str. LT2116]